MFWNSFFAQHLEVVVISTLILFFSLSVLRARKPAGSSFAWLLSITLMPYIGMPLYLIFGGRKIRRGIQLADPSVDFKKISTNTTFQPPLWLDDGIFAYETFLKQIQEAKKSIRIMTFVIRNDEVGRSLVKALTERVRAGVEVHFLIDDLLHFHAPRKELNELKEAGGHVRRFMPLMHIPFRGRSNLRNHRKIAIFDGERAIVGGMNLADEYMGPSENEDRWRDISVLLNHDSISKLDFVFRKNWEFASKEKISSAVDVKALDLSSMEVVLSGPDSQDDAIYEKILQALFECKKRFWIATPYFIPDETLMRALRMAVHRGVDVKIIVPSKSNHHLSDLAASSYLRDLSREGVDIAFYTPGMLHAKSILVDDKLAFIGSANFDMRSLFLNYEISLVFSTSPEVAHTERWFQETTKFTTSKFPQTGWVAQHTENIARLLAPLL